MKVIFVEARSTADVVLPAHAVKKLPRRVALFTTTQYLDNLDKVKAQLERAGKTVLLLKTKHTLRPGHLLGCNIQEFKEKLDCFLFVGDGLFHPIALAIKNAQPIYTYNPHSKRLLLLEESEVKKYQNKLDAAKAAFAKAVHVGIIISTKPGQYKLSKAKKLEKKHPDKEFYFLIFDTVDYSQLENFAFIECFVNTACERIPYDDAGKIRKPVVNLEEVL
jgi:2-(3-amino-3-carboxypropyl)histidine synthase